jgi:hypothetical protein
MLGRFSHHIRGLCTGTGQPLSLLISTCKPLALQASQKVYLGDSQYVSRTNCTPKSPRDLRMAGDNIGPPSKLDVKCPHQRYMSFACAEDWSLSRIGPNIFSMAATPSSNEVQSSPLGERTSNDHIFSGHVDVLFLRSPFRRTWLGLRPSLRVTSSGSRVLPLTRNSIV